MFVSIWDWFPFTFYALFVLVLNGLVLLLYQVESSIRQNKTNGLIANQCIGNILTSIILIPCYCASLYNRIDREFVLLIFAFFLLIASLTVLMTALEKLALFQDRLLILFNGKIMKALLLTWIFSALVAFIPVFTMIGVTAEDRNLISRQYCLVLLVIFLILFGFTVLVIGLTVVLGNRNIQKKTDQLSEIRNINEVVIMQHSINENKKHLKSTLVIIGPLLLALFISVSPWLHFVIHGNNKQNVVDSITMYIFCLKGLFDPIITFSVIANYQQAMLKYLGGHKFR